MNTQTPDYYSFVKEIFQNKTLVLIVTLSFAVFSVFYSLSLPNIYKSESILTATETTQNNSQTGSSTLQMLGLSGMGNTNISLIDKSLEIMKTPDFFREFYDDEVFLANLMAVDSVNLQTKKITYTQDFDSDDNLFRTKNFSFLEAHSTFLDKVTFEKNKLTNLYVLTVEHQSPIVAKIWSEKIIVKLSEYIKQKEIKKANDSLNYLQNKLVTTKISELKIKFSEMIKSHTQIVMLAEISDNFLFEIIQAPYEPIFKDRPARSIICIFITLIGFLFSIVLVLLKSYYQRNKNSILGLFKTDVQ